MSIFDEIQDLNRIYYRLRKVLVKKIQSLKAQDALDMKIDQILSLCDKMKDLRLDVYEVSKEFLLMRELMDEVERRLELSKDSIHQALREEDARLVSPFSYDGKFVGKLSIALASVNLDEENGTIVDAISFGIFEKATGTPFLGGVFFCYENAENGDGDYSKSIRFEPKVILPNETRQGTIRTFCDSLDSEDVLEKKFLDIYQKVV